MCLSKSADDSDFLQYLMPLMYLLLSRHLQVFAVCRTVEVDDNELWDAGRSMERMFSAVNIRHDELQGSVQHPLSKLQLPFIILP